MRLSIVIPAHNEEGNLSFVMDSLRAVCKAQAWDYEIVLVNDNSRDRTPALADAYARADSRIKVIHRRSGDNGLGNALREGTEKATGDIIVWMMSDRSDTPKDIVKMVAKINDGCDFVFGSRFIPGGTISNYPAVKLVSNRIFNNFLRAAFLIRQHDITNGFKAFRREVLVSVGPLTCRDFDITVELPLKARAAGFRFGEVPVSWHGRVAGVSSLKLSRTARKYLGTSFNVWIHMVRARTRGKHGSH